MALRTLGGLHLLLGMIIIVLAMTQLGYTGKEEDDIWEPVTPQPDRWQLYLYYPALAVLFSGLLVSSFSTPIMQQPNTCIDLLVLPSSSTLALLFSGLLVTFVSITHM